MASIDFQRARAFVAAVPTGRWTAYKDVADALARCCIACLAAPTSGAT